MTKNCGSVTYYKTKEMLSKSPGTSTLSVSLHNKLKRSVCRSIHNIGNNTACRLNFGNTEINKVTEKHLIVLSEKIADQGKRIPPDSDSNALKKADKTSIVKNKAAPCVLKRQKGTPFCYNIANKALVLLP